MPYADSAGTAIYYEAEGDPGGECVLFVHGAGGNAGIWYQQVEHFTGLGASRWISVLSHAPMRTLPPATRNSFEMTLWRCSTPSVCTGRTWWDSRSAVSQRSEWRWMRRSAWQASL